MAETKNREHLGSGDDLFEEAFLLQAQSRIQRLLNEKRLKYRDLSKRLGVSEARVSQMFGDEASNLTIRTIARIYHHLGEEPVILSRREFDRLSAGQDPSAPVSDTWTMVATDVHRFEVAHVQVVDEGQPTSEPRPARASEWIEALPMMTRTG